MNIIGRLKNEQPTLEIQIGLDSVFTDVLSDKELYHAAGTLISSVIFLLRNSELEKKLELIEHLQQVTKYLIERI